jgi:DNA repair exonuclease SbcCD nuclease subunit
MNYNLKVFSMFIITLLLFSPLVSAVTVKQRISIDIVHKINFKEIENNEGLEIIYPLSSCPVIVEKGKTFTIKFKTEECDRFYVYISTAYEPIVDEIELKVNSLKKVNLLWYATVLIPIDTPVELYNLTIVFEKNRKIYSLTEPRAVSVIEKFSDSFSFVHLTDFHIGDPRGARKNIRETIGWRAAKKAIQEINLLHPDFVIISGDLIFGALNPYEYRECYKILQLFDVPTFLCPGNHDGQIVFKKDGFDFWKKYFGSLNYSFNYGSYHFLAVNSYCWPSYQRTPFLFATFNWGGYIDDKEIEWIEEDLENNINANLTFMFLHHNPLWETEDNSIFKFRSEYYNRKKLLSLIDEYDVDMVLSGHVHHDNVTIINDTIYITTTTTASDFGGDAYWGYRLIEIKNGSISSYNYKDPKYSIPSYRINCIFKDSYTAILQNDLEKSIKVLIKFFVPSESYSVENGEILMERKKNSMSEVYVYAYVEKESSLTVTLYK